MMSPWFPIFVVICAGAAASLQPSINARLAQKVGILESALISFSVGTAALAFVLAISGKWTAKGLASTAWWEWTGGLLGAFFVSATILAVPKIGTAATMAAMIAAQLLTGLALDHFGVMGFGGSQFDLKRALGALLLIAGSWLIVRH